MQRAPAIECEARKFIKSPKNGAFAMKRRFCGAPRHMGVKMTLPPKEGVKCQNPRNRALGFGGIDTDLRPRRRSIIQ